MTHIGIANGLRILIASIQNGTQTKSKTPKKSSTPKGKKPKSS